MQKSLILVLLTLCLMGSLTVRAQSTGYTQPGSSSYTPPKEEEYEEEYEEKYEEEYEEEEEEYKYEEEEYEQQYTYGGKPDYEEEYSYGGQEEEEEEEYGYAWQNYTEVETEDYNYGGQAAYNNPTNKSYGYTPSEGYSGTYDDSKPSSVPKLPTSLLTGFVVDIHFLAVDTHFQYIAYHYCSDGAPGYTQCAIYNGTESNSRLIAVEVIVTEEIFKTLPADEQNLWHSHEFAVQSGLLVLPGVTAEQELQALQSVIHTYGKVTDIWHSWQTFPLGGPKLAYGITAANQINTTIADQLDKELKLSTTWKQRRQQRAKLTYPSKVQGADAWLKSGKYPQYVTQYNDVPSSN